MISAADPNATLAAFGHDAIWIVLVKVVAVFAFLVVMTLFSIVFER
jgi:NADH-quinone oxidoreductase subunit H